MAPQCSTPMSSSERLKRFKQRTGYTHAKLAEMFDVDDNSIQRWISGMNQMRPEHLQTLLRLEADFLCGEKSPLSPAGKTAFQAGVRAHL